jgi:hypothetical protein
MCPPRRSGGYALPVDAGMRDAISLSTPVALYFVLGERSKRILHLAVLCLIIGAKLIGDGISGF